MSGFKGKFYQINETGISGDFTINLDKQSDTCANIEITGDTTFKLSGQQFNQKCYLWLKINGTVSSIDFDGANFCSQDGSNPVLDLTDGAMNFIEFTYCENQDSAVIYKVVTNVKAIV